MVNAGFLNDIFFFEYIDMANHRTGGHVDSSRFEHVYSEPDGFFFLS